MKKDILNNKELNKIRRKYQKVTRIENKEIEIKKIPQDKLNKKWLIESKD
jgi:hypothetical protein